MSEFDKLYRELMIEMARPATILNHNKILNTAYAECLKIMREYGENNAPTFTIWDYIWSCLPEEIKTDDMVSEKRSRSAPNLKFFIIDILKMLYQHRPDIERQIIKDLTNEQKIENYLFRPLDQRGNRALGKARADGVVNKGWNYEDSDSSI